ncbi:hypothetical protein P175DRAFT_0146770 [Aspergillus ochraceoroseus IBT 24754]|uniref:Uncharacterized protein n=1 Tax=Aspergillus ochraceoroseus IBT 24754 TaxID=1392256 RepID=A0A2T5M2Q8_9EURO|nr:uncharacterized protein P175DRAFT_0146770 [Aspergillus ochraceoroseus IBT 24754]PTU22817.1 hypothetical protein P175DRAFT_0146770 [Aspergillus ochraceoroseus IBT 24754]
MVAVSFFSHTFFPIYITLPYLYTFCSVFHSHLCYVLAIVLLGTDWKGARTRLDTIFVQVSLGALWQFVFNIRRYSNQFPVVRCEVNTGCVVSTWLCRSDFRRLSRKLSSNLEVGRRA